MSRLVSLSLAASSALVTVSLTESVTFAWIPAGLAWRPLSPSHHWQRQGGWAHSCQGRYYGITFKPFYSFSCRQVGKQGARHALMHEQPPHACMHIHTQGWQHPPLVESSLSFSLTNIAPLSHPIWFLHQAPSITATSPQSNTFVIFTIKLIYVSSKNEFNNNEGISLLSVYSPLFLCILYFCKIDKMVWKEWWMKEEGRMTVCDRSERRAVVNV